jgi:hypothetical protein
MSRLFASTPELAVVNNILLADVGRKTMDTTNTVLNIFFTIEVIVLVVWQGFRAYM